MTPPNVFNPTLSPPLNPSLANLGVYASKAISQAAKDNPAILNMSIGEPAFGPPAHLMAAIAREDLSAETFLVSAKHYGPSAGSTELRQAIADWYQRRYGLHIDPEREILITHGGVEAVALAILCCTRPGEQVTVTEPSYMLYERALTALGRGVNRLYRERMGEQCTAETPAIVVNSPENPSGYMFDDAEWQALLAQAQRQGSWIIHDEVYDTMSFGRPHRPVRLFDLPGERTVLVNSLSKKFGTPGLRIGWLVGNPEFIAAASKASDYLILSVNQQYERIALRMLSDPLCDAWLTERSQALSQRAEQAMQRLTEATGFRWPHRPMGGMFLFPNVRQLFDALTPEQQRRCPTVGECVADYLLHKMQIATVPGIIYGERCAEHIRIVMGCDDATFAEVLARLERAMPGVGR
ncbi:pyridoxal phosphate-dependent aminotransferase [Pseudescherichia sp.]|uniref:pyridoxal phosphate-dependent aminotransferase n=1 Tax=Pseudescherichia sp. TaxID=2055881 RepID=UPI00289ED1ED|nr:pyridoxal phosphate-dependent aminotransferase [Pseudescherichia sp.]